ncbi:MAG: S1 RNA-binding domain-containing protein [Clostridium sp.]|nr:MAG: S1 RNA-binding domain-containing protein [Clostridium sp.]
MELKGTVRNVASFGAFVDIGLHDDGLLHISKMSKNFVKNPLDIVSVGDIITVYIDNINKETNKVNLSLIKKTN